MHDPICLQLQSLSAEKAQLRSLWEERKDQFEQCLDLQLFMRDTDQADNWMAKQEVHAMVTDSTMLISIVVPAGHIMGML